MLEPVKRLLAVAAITTAALAASAATADASTSTVTPLVTATSAVAVTQPVTNLEGKGSALKWSPKSIKAAPVPGACSATNYSFLILNETKVDQQVEYSKGALGSLIAPKDGLYVCSSGPIRTTLWPEADRKAKLKMDIT
jgi:hypothetical protein